MGMQKYEFYALSPYIFVKKCRITKKMSTFAVSLSVKRNMKKVTILIPCFNEEASLPALYQALKELMDAHSNYAWEVLMVNDGSHDHTIDIIKECLLDTLGGWMVLRYTETATYIDYLAAFTETNSQPVEFARNLTDFERELDGADVFNAILPTGANGLTIASLSDGDLTADQVKSGTIIYSRNGRARFRHRITKIIDWPDVTVAANLQAKASAYLAAHGGASTERISCSAIDLSFSADSDIESFRVGRMTTVKSDPHGVDTAYPLTEISIPDLRAPGSAEITLGNVAATISAALRRN